MALDRFHVSSFCLGGECVAVAAQSDGMIAVRSTREADVLRFTPSEWDAFVAGVRSGEFEREALSAPQES